MNFVETGGGGGGLENFYSVKNAGLDTRSCILLNFRNKCIRKMISIKNVNSWSKFGHIISSLNIK